MGFSQPHQPAAVFKLIQSLAALQMTSVYAPENNIDMVRNVYTVKRGDDLPIISEITQKEKDILNQLGVYLKYSSLKL